MKDYYKILGLSRNSTEKSVKQKFKELAFETHPDVSERQNAADIFMDIYEAYQILGNPEKRAGYDRLYDKYFNRSSDKIVNEDTITRDVQDAAEQAREKARQKSQVKYSYLIREMDCYFTKGRKADGHPLYYNMHKTTGISGGTGPMGSIKSTSVSIPIPRSKKAAFVHIAGFIIKALFFALMIYSYRLDFLKDLSTLEMSLLSFAILLTGGIATYTMYRLNGTKSKYFNAYKYLIVRKYRKKGYKRGFHPMISTTPIGLIAYALRLIF